MQLRNPQGGISLNIWAEDTYEAPIWPEQRPPQRGDSAGLPARYGPAAPDGTITGRSP